MGKKRKRLSRSDTFLARSKVTGRPVEINDRYADTVLSKGYDVVPKIPSFGGLDFDEEGNIIP